jgi:hypothetical protein
MAMRGDRANKVRPFSYIDLEKRRRSGYGRIALCG